MTTMLTAPDVLSTDDFVWSPDQEDLAAAAFLARYRGRTEEAYRHDLRCWFQRAARCDLDVLAATRGHLELYRASMEQRGLADSTIDRRLSKVCGCYRFAHLDGRISANPAQHVRRPRVQPAEGRRTDRSELARFLFIAERYDRAHTALAVLLGPAFEHGHRTLHIIGKAASPPPSRSPRAAPAPSIWSSGNGPPDRSCDVGTGSDWIGAPRTAGSPGSASGPGSAELIRTCCARVGHGRPRRRCVAAGRATRGQARRSSGRPPQGSVRDRPLKGTLRPSREQRRTATPPDHRQL